MVATAIPEETEQVIKFTIGELASAADVNVETVRYYQRRQLIDLPAKPQHGYRTYPLDTLHKIRFIKRAQELGFSLAEIGRLLTLSTGSCSTVQTLAERKLLNINNKIADLRRMQSVLIELLEACEANRDPKTCPIVESLVDEFVEDT